MAMIRGVMRSGNWVRESEHIVLRLVSLVFSVGSAYAVRWFFEPLDSGDPIHYVLWWIVAAGFGVLGFYLSRSLTHRMMAKEPVWAYVPVFALVEFFEILCNYAKAVSAVSAGTVSWVVHAPASQQGVMTLLTYVGWSILPLVSPSMAVADMDMTRRRNGETVAGPAAVAPRSAVGPTVYRPSPAPSPVQGPLPKVGPSSNGSGGGAGWGQATHGAVNRAGTWTSPKAAAPASERSAMPPLPPKQEPRGVVHADVPLEITTVP